MIEHNNIMHASSKTHDQIILLLCKSRLQRPGCSLLLGLCEQRPCWTGRPFQRPLVDSSSGGCGHPHLPPHLTLCGGGDHEGLLSPAAPELAGSVM